MQYMHEVWVNWKAQPLNSLLIPFYFEWENNDNIEVYAKIPIFKVSEKLFNAFLTHQKFKVPFKMKEAAFNQSVSTTGSISKVEQCCFMVTSPTLQTLVINTKGTDYALWKSRLPFRQEVIAEELFLTSVEDIIDVDTELVDALYDDFLHNDSLYRGLSRLEKEKKAFILVKLHHSKEKNERNKLAFLYSEFSDVSYKQAIRFKSNTIYKKIMERIQNGWTKECESFYTHFYKGL